MDDSNIVNALDWMLHHRGIAVARKVNNKEIEIIKHSESPDEYEKLECFAKKNDLYIVVGGYSGCCNLLPSLIEVHDDDSFSSPSAIENNNDL
jgi:hypothetical protein